MNDAFIVDAHHHLWSDPTLDDYPWMAGQYIALRRSYTAVDLQPLLIANGVRSTIVVQSRSSLDESRWLLEMAGRTDFIAGVVAWVDLMQRDVGDQLHSLQRSPGGELLVGIRHQVHDEVDPNWLLKPEVKPGLRAVEEAGLVYDLLVKEPQLPAAHETARSFPNLRFVIDHLAKPRIRDGGKDAGWEEGMAPLSDLPNVACKLSGMVTEADWASWRAADLAPYVQRVVEWFGPERLIFGSDWPVCLLAARYDQVLRIVQSLISDVPDEAQRGILGANAIRWYRIKDAVKEGA